MISLKFIYKYKICKYSYNFVNKYYLQDIYFKFYFLLILILEINKQFIFLYFFCFYS